MSNDKTLATVKHGGCVQLGDGLPPLPIRQRFTTLHGETYAYSAEQMREYALAALSAQPSPGGQGDARAIIEEFVQCATLGRPHGKLIAQANDYLSARQPVGEAFSAERIRWFERAGEYLKRAQVAETALANFDRFRATSRRQCAVSFLLDRGFVWNDGQWKARQPVGEPVAFRSRYIESDRVGMWMYHRERPMYESDVEVQSLYAAPPAQAVDLRQLKRFELFADEGPGLGGMSVDYEETDTGAWVRFDDVKALIDGQAVGK